MRTHLKEKLKLAALSLQPVLLTDPCTKNMVGVGTKKDTAMLQ